jgi:cytidylate kinase
VDFSEADYRARGFFERLFRRRSARVVTEVGAWRQDTSGSRAVAVEQLDEEWCVRMVKSTIREAHKQGDMIIVGRGGQAVLQDEPGVLHVRVEAPVDARVRRIQYQEMTGMAMDQQQQAAQDRVRERDRAAEDYLRRFHDIDWADPGLYHLVIDTEKWNIDGATCLIAAAVGCLPPARS